MGNNTDKNSSNINDGILWGIGFISMAFILFFVAFFMGKEIEKRDKMVFEEYTKTLESDRNEMTEKLESIELKIVTLELKIGDLEEKIDEMRKAATDAGSGVDTDASDIGTADNPNVSKEK